jgi:hypothetical protein
MLYNFIMNSEQLSYSSLESVDNMHVNYYYSYIKLISVKDIKV